MCNILDTRVVRILLPVVNERTDDNNHDVQDVEAKVPYKKERSYSKDM